jgi:aquaporin TIP
VAGTRALANETLGTFLLLAVGGWVESSLTGPAVAVGWGMLVAGLVAIAARSSGAHFNPAVTLGLWWTGCFPRRSVVPYLAAQTLGALAGAAAAAPLGADLLLLHPMDAPLGAVLAAEAAAAALLAVTIRIVVARQAPVRWAATAIGAAVAIGILAAGPISGAGMNPVRILAPSLLGGSASTSVLLAVAALAGGLAGMAGHRLVQGPTCCGQRVALKGLRA